MPATESQSWLFPARNFQKEVLVILDVSWLLALVLGLRREFCARTRDGSSVCDVDRHRRDLSGVGWL